MTLRKLRIGLLRGAFALIALLAVFVRPRWPVGGTTAVTVELVGYVFLLAGLVVRIWSILYIGGRKSDVLVTDGPYSLCRNPLYAGTFLLAIGAGLCFENIPMLLAAVAVVLPLHLLAARLEEKHLEAKFPAEYPLYRQRVPRFLPRFRNYHSSRAVEVPVRAIRRVVVDTVAVLLIPEMEDLLEVLHDHGLLPVLWHFP